MSFWEFLGSRSGEVAQDTYLHASLTLQCMLIATVIALAIGMSVYRRPRVATLAQSTAAVFLTIPSLALFGLLIPVVGLGVAPTFIALTLYALLPILRNAVVGLVGVDQAMIEAARGMGMSRTRILLRIELPLAWPVVLTGIRISTQMIIGIAAIAAYVNGPGLGNLIFRGLSSLGSSNAVNFALAGTLGVVFLAILFDAAFVLIGRLTTSRGLRV